MTNKHNFLLLSLGVPLFFCVQNASGMLKKRGWKIKWKQKKTQQVQEKLPSTYVCRIGSINLKKKNPTLFVGSVPGGNREAQLELFKTKLTLKKIGKFFYPNKFDGINRGCRSQQKSTRSRMWELVHFLRKTDFFDTIGPDQKASIKFLITELPKKKLREKFKFLSDKNGNHLLFFTVKEGNLRLFGKLLECAGTKIQDVVLQKSKCGTSVLDLLKQMEAKKRENFLSLLNEYNVFDFKGKR